MSTVTKGFKVHILTDFVVAIILHRHLLQAVVEQSLHKSKTSFTFRQKKSS